MLLIYHTFIKSDILWNTDNCNIQSLLYRLSAFGAWAAGGWMWGQTDRHEAIKAMRAAYAEGMTSFDTAPIYGQGESEEIVGEALQDIPRDKVQILTKFGLRWDLK